MHKEIQKKRSRFREIWRRFRKNKAAMVGLFVIFFFIIIAVFADVIVPYEKTIEQNPANALTSPCSEHWFGTDNYGRDIFARIIHGTRISLAIGVLASILALVIGGIIGALAGYYGGKTDNIIMRAVDIFSCIPSTLLSLTIVTALGANMQNLMIALTVTNVQSVIRLVRSSVLTVVGMDYIKAAKSYGAKDLQIIMKHVLHNAIGPIIVNTTMNIAGIILGASSLSFIGVGVQPPMAEWGAMLSDAKKYIQTAPYILYFPGIAILLAALGFNLVGDGLRDALDPKLKD